MSAGNDEAARQLGGPNDRETRKSGIHIFGVRHLSPGGAWHLLQLLDAVRPTAVLIEGPSDATSQIPHLSNEATRPPVAILA
ncbi:DUF5682 family protein, partial [Paenibacillus forsythiae]